MFDRLMFILGSMLYGWHGPKFSLLRIYLDPCSQRSSPLDTSRAGLSRTAFVVSVLGRRGSRFSETDRSAEFASLRGPSHPYSFIRGSPDMRPNIIYPIDNDGLLESPPRRVSASQSPIFIACFNRAWHDVIKRVKSHPSDVFLQDELSGNTALHEACRLDPPSAVIRVLKATSRIKNDLGATPVHIAASHRCSVDALGVLLDCASKLGEKSPCTDLTNMERAPIHYACVSFRGLDIAAFMLLLDRTLKDGYIKYDHGREPSLGFEDVNDDEDEFYDSLDSLPDIPDKFHDKVVINVMSLKDTQGHTPLALLFGRYRQRVRSVISSIDTRRRESKRTPEQAALISALEVHGELGELWEKARRIVTRLTEARLEHEGNALEESMHQAPSPGAIAERQGAAAWAAEKHRAGDPSEKDVLPVYVDVADRDTNSSPVNNATTNTRRFRIVHASVGLIGYGCPPEMIRLAISIHPHQVKEMDEDGNLPLHIAVKSSSFLGKCDMLSMEKAAAAAVGPSVSDDASLLSDSMSFFSSATISQTIHPFDKVCAVAKYRSVRLL
jgi:ankyrin repeat protein